MSRRALVVLGEALRREPRRLVGVVCWSVAEAAPAFVIGHAIARAIEDGFAAGRPWTGLGWLAVLGGAWLVAAAGARQVILAVAAIVEPFRDRLLTRVVGGALRRAESSGRLPGGGSGGEREHAAVARSTLQVELARDAFAAVITVVRTFVFTVASVILGISTLFPEALVLVLPPFVAGLLLFLVSLPVLARRQREFIVADERTLETVTAMVGGLRDIVACGAEERVGATAGRQVTRQADAGRVLARVTAVRTLALAAGGRLPVVAVLAGTPWLIRHGAGPGVIIGMLAYITQSLTPALHGLVEGLGVSGVRLMVSLDRILQPEDPVEDGPRGRPTGTGAVVARGGGDAHVELRDVTFAYGPHAEPVIAGLDLVVPAGDHLAVVGPSGIGKSTLAALITGMLVPDEGEVLVGGVRADRLDPAERVLIPQEAYVFRGTLLDNLTYLAPDAPDRAVAAAVEAVGMRDLLRRVGGYSGEIDPGALSAGERQLIALTRSYLAAAHPGHAHLAILDEATCHLDPAAEARAELAFARGAGTLIVIAHRISSAVRARRVLLMDGTRVLLGTHEELIGAAPLYADLVGHWGPPDRDHHAREFVR
ncbi:MAG TPA: ABC transporter ATP-binding protein [Streptosporangiaceae bacterium]|nr:ABC transporter ATP-binding protein [Streptosporangiaceae bacterium]